MGFMSDTSLLLELLVQIDTALKKIAKKAEKIDSAEYFSSSEEGEEKLDSICMLFMAVGENLKKIDSITNGSLLAKYPSADWTGAKGFRDIVAHQYFDVDPEQVFQILSTELNALRNAVGKIISETKL